MDNKKGFCSEFVVAAEKGDIEEVKKLFEIVCTLSEKNEQCYYALYFAAFNGHESVVEFLLSQNVDPNFAVGNYLTPLHAAVFSKQRKGFAVTKLRDTYLRTLHRHLTKEEELLPEFSENILSILLNHGANVNPKIRVSSGQGTVESSYVCSPLHAAIYCSDEKAVEMLLQRGASVSDKIQSAVKDKPKDDVKSSACESVSQRYDPESKDEKRLKNRSASLRKIITFEIDKPVSQKSKQEQEFEKSLNYGEILKSFIHHDWHYNHIGCTPLHLAISWGHKENILKMLLEKGANVNDRSEKDLTLLASACQSNYVSPVKTLLAAGADLNVEVDNGSHLLRCILKNTFYRGRDFYDGYIAKTCQNENAVFNYLLQIGVDPNGWSSRKKENVIHYAASRGMYYAVHLLLKYGANSNSIDGESKPPLEYAIKNLRNVLKQVQSGFFYELETSSSDDSRWFTDSTEEEEEEDYEREIERRRKARELRRYQLFKNKTIYNLSHNKYKYNKYKYKKELYEVGINFSAMRDPHVHRMISQLLTRDLVRLEARGTRIIQQNVELLETDFVKPFYIECKNELERLKKRFLVDGVSYYDFLQADDTKLQEYVGNKNIVDLLTGDACQKLFPNYCRFLRVNADRGRIMNSEKNKPVNQVKKSQKRKSKKKRIEKGTV